MITLTKLKEYQQDILSLADKYHVANPRVFGSVLTGEQTKGSDIDILVDATEDTTLFDIGGLQQELNSLLGTPVDILTPEDLNSSFRAKVLSAAQVI